MLCFYDKCGLISFTIMNPQENVPYVYEHVKNLRKAKENVMTVSSTAIGNSIN